MKSAAVAVATHDRSPFFLQSTTTNLSRCILLDCQTVKNVEMSVSKCQEVSKLDRTAFASFLASFDTILADCDGVLYRGNLAVPGAADLVNHMHSSIAKKVIYITNNSVKTRAETVGKLKKMNFPVSLETAFHAGYLAALYLKNIDFQGKAYVVGGRDAIQQELTDLGINSICNTIDVMPEDYTLEMLSGTLDDQDNEINAVIVGFDYHMSYLKIMKATNYLAREKSLFLVTDHDAVFPMLNGTTLPGTGPLVTAIKTASGRDPIVCGKPSTFAFETIRSAHPEISPERTLMIGDRADSDILMGKRCGLKTLLVGSGINSLEDIRKWEEEGKMELVPDFYAESLGHLFQTMTNLGV